MKVTIYSTDFCSHCDIAKDFLTKRDIEYQEVNLARDDKGREQLFRLSGNLSFPQIVIGDKVIGGLRELITAEQDGTLEKLLEINV